MAELKTKQTEQDVNQFIGALADEKKRQDSIRILELMKELTGETPKLWGTSIIGFGNYHYKYGSGRQGDWFLTGFSPRKQNISLYLMAGYVAAENPGYDKVLKELGKCKIGAGCVYINKLEDVNLDRLKELVKSSIEYLKKKYPA